MINQILKYLIFLLVAAFAIGSEFMIRKNKKPRDPKMSPEEKARKREIVFDATRQLIWISEAAAKSGQHTGNVMCCGCHRRLPLVYVYRCYHCGLVLCEKCSKEHFGKRPTRNDEYFKQARDEA